MIERLQERGDGQTHDAAHEGREREHDGGDVDGEAGVREQRVEHDADAFAAVDDAEGVEGDGEEEGRRARQVRGEGAEQGEDQAGEDLEGEFEGRVLEEEGGGGVGGVGVFAVEDLREGGEGG